MTIPRDADLGDDVVRKAQRLILKRFREKRKREHKCQDCGMPIEQYSRCQGCRRKRNAKRRLRQPA